MTTARHLDTIDLLRSREFPAEPAPSDVGSAGPGYHIAELNGHFGPVDADTDDHGEADQRLAEHDALLDALGRRWGEPDLFSLVSTRMRAEADPTESAEPAEGIPEPWLRLSSLFGWVHLWRIEDRWIGIGLSTRQLLAVVTATDPP